MNEDGTTEAVNRGLREHTQALEAINRQLHEHIAQLTIALRDGARRETALNERIAELEKGLADWREVGENIRLMAACALNDIDDDDDDDDDDVDGDEEDEGREGFKEFERTPIDPNTVTHVGLHTAGGENPLCGARAVPDRAGDRDLWPHRGFHVPAPDQVPLKIADIRLGMAVDVRSPDFNGRGVVAQIYWSALPDRNYVRIEAGGILYVCRPEYLFATVDEDGYTPTLHPTSRY